MIVHARPPRNDTHKSIHQKGRPFNSSFSLWLSKLLSGLVFAPQRWHRFDNADKPRCHGQLRRVCSYQPQGCSPKMLGSWHDIAIEHVSSACLIIQGCTRYRAYQIIIDYRCSSWGSRNCWLVDFVWFCGIVLLLAISHVFFEGSMLTALTIEDAADQEAEDKAVSDKCTLLRTRLGGLPEEDRQFGDQDFLHFFDDDVCCVSVNVPLLQRLGITN